MPTKVYNNFTPGIAQDDWQTAGGKLIEGNNVTGLRSGYGLSLGPKSNKLFTTNGAMRGIYVQKQAISPDNSESFAFGDAGEIYRFDGADNTPVYTVTNGGTVKGLINTPSDYLFLYEDTPGGNLLNLGFNGSASNWDTVDENYDNGFIAHSDMVPIIKAQGSIYFGGSSKVVRLTDEDDPLASKQNFSIFKGTCQGITKTGNQFYLYTTNQEVIIWDGASSANTGSNIINFPPRKVHQIADRVYSVSRDGELRVGNSYQFQKIVKTVKSERLEDNTSFKTKFDFSGTTEKRGQYITNVGCNETIPGIYIYDNIVEGTTKGLHKAITRIHDGTAIDEIYAIDYDHTQDRVFYSYKAGTTYGIDYIDVQSKETQQTGYAVTEVFSSNTAFIKRPKQLRVTTSNTSGNNYVKVYERVNNGTWNLLRTINNDTDEIAREEIKSYTKENIDVQFKLELYNDSQGEQPPIVHEVFFDYDIIAK